MPEGPFIVILREQAQRFAGNKNEVLFRIRLHPLSQVDDLPARTLRALPVPPLMAGAVALPHRA